MEKNALNCNQKTRLYAIDLTADYKTSRCQVVAKVRPKYWSSEQRSVALELYGRVMVAPGISQNLRR